MNSDAIDYEYFLRLAYAARNECYTSIWSLKYVIYAHVHSGYYMSPTAVY